MPSPAIEVLGVYRLPVDRQLVERQTEELYGFTGRLAHWLNALQVRAQLGSTVLLELLVSNRDRRFKVAHFCQPCWPLPKNAWQVACEEVFLSLDGQTRLDVPFLRLPDEPHLRIAFFLHYWLPHVPLCSSYGHLRCPRVRPMPDRLRRLVPYEPID